MHVHVGMSLSVCVRVCMLACVYTSVCVYVFMSPSEFQTSTIMVPFFVNQVLLISSL